MTINLLKKFMKIIIVTETFKMKNIQKESLIIHQNCIMSGATWHLTVPLNTSTGLLPCREIKKFQMISILPFLICHLTDSAMKQFLNWSFHPSDHICISRILTPGSIRLVHKQSRNAIMESFLWFKLPDVTGDDL